MLEAVDTELGCLLKSIDEKVLSETTIILVGDNGTPPGMVDPILAGAFRGKGSVSRGGIQVPLIVSGKHVVSPPGGRPSETLVNASDIYATTVEILTGGLFNDFAPQELHDSTSFLPSLNAVCSAERNWIYAEVNFNSFWRAIRGPRYKLMLRGPQGTTRCTVFYDLQADPLELCPLVRFGTLCGEESQQGDCPPSASSLHSSDPCLDFAECVRLRDQMTALTATRDAETCDASLCDSSTNFCAEAGVLCSFDGRCGLSGLCNSTCVSDTTCTGPASIFPTGVALVPACLGS
jgi:hypothetical protein